jgi:hypothetical protein
VNVLDVLLVIVAISAAVAGYRLGFVARATSWAGLALGVTVGALVLPSLLRHLRGASDVTVALVAIAALAGTALLGQALGLVLGTRLNVALPEGPVRRIDQVVGRCWASPGCSWGCGSCCPRWPTCRGWCPSRHEAR